MIPVFINKPQFEYDIHSLVKAFYPGEEVKVFCVQTKEEEQSCLREDMKMSEAVRICFEENAIVMKKVSDAQDILQRAEYEPDTERAEVKNILKQLIYKGLSAHLNKELPWGTLTGIRPTKIPMTMLEEGKSKQEILDYMKQTYYISEEKEI